MSFIIGEGYPGGVPSLGILMLFLEDNKTKALAITWIVRYRRFDEVVSSWQLLLVLP